MQGNRLYSPLSLWVWFQQVLVIAVNSEVLPTWRIWWMWNKGAPPNSSLGIIWLLCLDPLWNQIVRWLFILGTSLFPIPSSIYQPRKELIPQSIHQQVFVKYPCLCHCSKPCNILKKKTKKKLPQPSYRLPFWLDRTQEKLQNGIEILNWSKAVLEYLLIPSKLRGRRIWND